MSESRLATIIVLGSTQTLAWASSYYLPAILADAIAADLGITATWIFAAFSASLLVSAAIGPGVGRRIDAFGGAGVLGASNIVMAAGLAVLGLSTSIAGLAVAWFLLGAGMGLGLYDAAFATLGRIYGASARGAITGITLIAGFASTVGWPLTSWGLAEIGWRNTCFAWAAAHILLALPLNVLLLPRPQRQPAPSATHASQPHVAIDRTMILLGAAFAFAWMVTGAMAAHFPRIMRALGASSVDAIAAGVLIGPAQVAARMIEAGYLKRFHPLVTARIATLGHPLGALLIGLSGGAAGLTASAFALLHGGGNGVLTISRGTVPLALFGPQNYGYRLGLIGAPARILQALSPLLFGWLIDRAGAGALIATSALSLAALASLCLLPASAPPPQQHG